MTAQLTTLVAGRGESASEIVDAAEREGVDLVAMATHGRAGFDRLVQGSVTEQVLRRSRHPLLVLRGPDEATT